jgi:hypothetical protein
VQVEWTTTPNIRSLFGEIIWGRLHLNMTDHISLFSSSLGLQGNDCVFVNLAAVAGPVAGKQDALMDVNYRLGLSSRSILFSVEHQPLLGWPVRIWISVIGFSPQPKQQTQNVPGR